MTKTTRASGTRPTGGGFHLQLHMAKPDAPDALALAVASFTASLDSTDRSELDLAGVSGVIVDTAKLETDGPICITIHDALKRHTPPKRTGLASDDAAQRDLDAGTDGRIACDTRYALFLWLPEIYDGSKTGVGTRLLRALRETLPPEDDVSVLVDFGVEDEQDGFVKIFYPRLRDLGLKLSDSGQFAHGRWDNALRARRATREIGIVHL